MTIDEWLRQAQMKLETVSIATARLDALVLLENAMGVDRAQILAHLEIELPSDVKNLLDKQLRRRAEHEPLAFVLGKTEFYGREFIITPAVLEPRPESETMIELLLRLPGVAHFRIADVGTGSGALGITTKLELPEAFVELIEIDPNALEVAKMNVTKFTTDILTIQSDLLNDTQHDYDVLLCNLPYVPDSHTINKAAMHEPKIAIFGGPDGLDLYRRLFEQIKKRKNKPLLILTESLPPQHEALKGIAEAAGYTQTREDDFIQVFSNGT